MWLPMKEFLDGEVYFLESNPDTTFTEPAGGEHTMTVSYYNSQENTVDINSGRGYTRDERIKPDYAAPGVAVTGAVPGGGFKERTGSDVASDITKKTGDTLEIQKIKSNVRTLKRANERDLADIGRMVYEKFQSGEVSDMDYVTLCEEIEKREEEIEKQEEEIVKIQGEI